MKNKIKTYHKQENGYFLINKNIDYFLNQNIIQKI